MKTLTAYLIFGATLAGGWLYFNSTPISQAYTLRGVPAASSYAESEADYAQTSNKRYGLEKKIDSFTKKFSEKKNSTQKSEGNAAQNIIERVNRHIGNLSSEEYSSLFRKFMKNNGIKEVDGVMRYDNSINSGESGYWEEQDRKSWARKKDVRLKEWLLGKAKDELRKQAYLQRRIDDAEEGLYNEILSIQKDNARGARRRSQEMYAGEGSTFGEEVEE